MKRFLMFSIGCLCLAVSALIGFHIGSSRVEAQAPTGTLGFTATINDMLNVCILLDNGDVYWRTIGINHDNGHRYFEGGAPSLIGNFWDGPVSTDQSTLGAIKGMKK